MLNLIFFMIKFVKFQECYINDSVARCVIFLGTVIAISLFIVEVNLDHSQTCQVSPIKLPFSLSQ